MQRVDAFVIADELQFTASGWAHRNRVRGPRGVHWLTVPTRNHRLEAIKDVEIADSLRWRERHLRTLRHFYRASPYAQDVLAGVEGALAPGAQRLVEVTVPLIRFMMERFGIALPLLVSSTLGLERSYAARFPERPGPTHRIIAYMKALGADELIEGETGSAYLDLDLCARHGIKVRFHRYRHPAYPQLFEPFYSHLSAIDLLLACGNREAAAVLRAGEAELS